MKTLIVQLCLLLLTQISYSKNVSDHECGTTGSLAERISNCNQKINNKSVLAHFPVKVEGKIVLWCTAVFNESTNAIEFPKPEDSNGANENLEAYWEQAGHNLSPLSELVQSYKAGYESGLNKSCEHKPTSEKIIDDNILKSNSAAKKSLDIKNNNYSKKSLDIKNNNYSKQSLKYK